MDAGDYQVILMLTAGVIYTASEIYFNRKTKKRINNFTDRVNNYIIPEANRVQKSVNKLEELTKN